MDTEVIPKHQVGTRVRVIEEGDYRNGTDGVVSERMRDDVATFNRHRVLVCFNKETMCRWYADCHLESLEVSGAEEV